MYAILTILLAGVKLKDTPPINSTHGIGFSMCVFVGNVDEAEFYTLGEKKRRNTYIHSRTHIQTPTHKHLGVDSLLQTDIQYIAPPPCSRSPPPRCFVPACVQYETMHECSCQCFIRNALSPSSNHLKSFIFV